MDCSTDSGLRVLRSILLVPMRKKRTRDGGDGDELAEGDADEARGGRKTKARKNETSTQAREADRSGWPSQRTGLIAATYAARRVERVSSVNKSKEATILPSLHQVHRKGTGYPTTRSLVVHA